MGASGSHQASLIVTAINSNVLVEILSLDSLIEADPFGLSFISSTCATLSEGAVTVDKLWPGDIYDLPTYVFHTIRGWTTDLNLIHRFRLLYDKQLLTRSRNELLELRRVARTLERLQVSLDLKMRLMERNVQPCLQIV